MLELDLTKSQSELADLNAHLKTPGKITISESAIDEALNKGLTDNILAKAQLETSSNCKPRSRTCKVA